MKKYEKNKSKCVIKIYEIVEKMSKKLDIIIYVVTNKNRNDMDKAKYLIATQLPTREMKM
jgi:hypothetical protein